MQQTTICVASTVFDPSEFIGVYALTYTPASELAGDTVCAENYTLTSDKTSRINILDTYYYPGENQVKLIIETKKAAAGAPCRLTSENLLNTEGQTTDCDETVYLFSENEVSYGTVDISAVSYLIGNVPAGNTSGKSGITVVVRLSNTTGVTQQGTVAVFDGGEAVVSAPYSVDSEGFAEITLDASAHTFTTQATINIQ